MTHDIEYVKPYSTPLPMAQQPPLCQDLLTIDASQSPHSDRHTILGNTSQARQRDVYLTANDSHMRQASNPPLPAGFKPTITRSVDPGGRAV